MEQFLSRTNLVVPFLALEPVLILLGPVPRRLVLVQERPIGQLAQHGLVLALGQALVLGQTVGLGQTGLAQWPFVQSCNMPKDMIKSGSSALIVRQCQGMADVLPEWHGPHYLVEGDCPLHIFRFQLALLVDSHR